MPTTEYLLDRLDSDKRLRRICGWEKRSDVPSSATFSRAFAEFSNSKLAEIVHAEIIDRQMGEQLIGHISRDSTAIIAREKPVVTEVKPEPPKKTRSPQEGRSPRKKDDAY